MVERGSLNMLPNFRTHINWPSNQRSNFIESVYLGMPVDNIICEENLYGELTVLDGTQRLKAIVDFLNNDLTLKDLTLLKHLNGKKFRELNYNDTLQITNRLTLNFLSISYDTHPILKFEFFKRINYGKIRFPIQSARNYAFPYTKSLIDDLKNEFSLQLKFEERNSFKNRSELSWATEIDQFYLYLALVIALKNNIIDTDDQNESVSELLDRFAFMINDKKYINGMIVDDMYITFKKCFSNFSYLRKIHVSTRDEMYDDKYKLSDFLDMSEISLSMDKFVHVIIQGIKSLPSMDISELIYDSDTLVPEYFEMRKKIKFLNKEIFGRNYASNSRN
jgi:hypothetical protein